MSQMRLLQQLDGVIRWMTGTLDRCPPGEGIAPVHVETWRDALVALRGNVRDREQALITAEALASDARLDAIDEEDRAFGVTSAMALVVVLARMAAENRPDETADVDRMACAIVDTIETLSRGVLRPAETPLKGA